MTVGTATAVKPYRAFHVGRRGEVAGGMTQVVNGYLGWDFDRFDVDVIVSRDGSHGLRGALLFLGAAGRLLRLGRRSSSVIVVHLSQGGSFVREGALLLLARAAGFPTVAHLHGSSFAAFAARRPGLTRTVLRAAKRVLVLSDESFAIAARLVPGERVRRVPNVVAADRPEEKRRRVVFGGSVSHRKGVDVLLAAWRELAPAGWTLDVVGPVADPEVVDESVPHVVFHGALPHAELMALLRTAAVAVLPSRDEALPMFLLEALARDAAVVATDVGGVAALLEGGAGVVVPPGDVAALRDALAAVLTDDDRRARLVQRGRRRFAERYSAEAGYPLIEALWAESLA